MREHLLQVISNDGQTLGMLHDEAFLPTQSPRAQKVSGGRIAFEQTAQESAIADVQVVRVPLCLLAEGDTALLRRAGQNGSDIFETIVQNTPTAAALFDAVHVPSEQTEGVVWFCEDSIFAKTIAATIQSTSEDSLRQLLGMGERTANLIEQLTRRRSARTRVYVLSFSDSTVIAAIKDAIIEEAVQQGFENKPRKNLRDTTAVQVASTHGLFPNIVERVLDPTMTAGVVGPVHLETTPPRWRDNQDMRRALRFTEESAKNNRKPHRSLFPCLFQGEPIAEFSAFEESGPQLRRDQRHKLVLWTEQDPFPLMQNPIFGHGIGLLDNPAIAGLMEKLFESEKKNDRQTAIECQKTLAGHIDTILESISFWK